ncbi:MAG TPA: transglutaminase family protein, partial [Candidatus Synoicihabitans sp.]|nr:transglutaminase family protein [Candidatus Synoicihabitans sp.]
MNWLRIIHRTHYTYHRLVHFGEHRLVLRPREGHDLRVEHLNLIISPAHEIEWSRDVFGNSVALVQFAEAADELDIVNDVLVWRPDDAVGPAAAAPSDEWPVVYDPLETVVAGAYRQSVYPEDGDAVRQWVQQLDFPAPRRAENVLAHLNAVVHRTFTYRRRQERGVLTPAEVLRTRSGSCRDLATLMLEAARALGFAARFASGYLDCAASIAGNASTHAWMEAYLPSRGWRGFDPTLGENTSLQHVVTGVSNHP